MVRASLRVFTEHPAVDLVLPVIHPDDSARFAAATEGLRLATPVPGAATRQGSVRAGLESLSKDAPEIVLVHDAARPFTSQALVTRAIETARARGAAIPGLAVTDAVKLVDDMASSPRRSTAPHCAPCRRRRRSALRRCSMRIAAPPTPAARIFPMMRP